MSDPLARLRDALADRYEVEREAGQGGMATVYRAYDPKHDRHVAIKVLRPDLAAALGADRFLREIRITAKFNHPHILPLYDSGEANGFVYYVMPFVHGESLRDRLRRDGRLPIMEAVTIARQVADALDYAHRHDVMHRDVKPENILLEDGHAVVADFGIARALTSAGADQITQTGLAVGTPAYMSPEQATAGSPLDARTDIYSLGCVLFEMLTGAPPFTGSVPEVISKRFTTTVPSAALERRETPPDVEAALEKALAPMADDRFTTASDFAVALGATATPTTGTPGALPTPRVRRAILLAGGALVLVIAGALWLRRGDDRVETVLAQLAPAVEAGRLGEIHDRLQAEGLRLEDRGLAELAAQVAGTATLESEPAGASVVLTRVDPVERFPARQARDLGRTPVEHVTLVAGEYLATFEAPGRSTLRLPLHVETGDTTTVTALLVAEDSSAGNVVAVPAGPSPLANGEGVVPAFLMDRHEVTNADYLAFVNAGGYRDTTFWPDTLRLEGGPVPRADALGRFVDRTGLPGPRGWSQGRFATDAADQPVVGVSWYEAQAYARWAGAALPTWDQWWRAALGDRVTAYPWGNDVLSVEARANFGMESPASVGTHPLDVSPFGVLDMAGNVREWLAAPADGAAERTAVGGFWQGPTYMFEASHAEHFPSSYASEFIGLRLVRPDASTP